MAETINRLDAVFKKEQGSELAEKIAALYDRRDKALTSLILITRAYLNYFDDTKAIKQIYR